LDVFLSIVNRQSSFVNSLRSTLLSARNADGGWPYYKGKQSRLEPTCAALLALGHDPAPLEVAVLERWPRRDGLFVDAAGEVNVAFNGLAGVVLAGTTTPVARPLFEALVAAQGVVLPDSPANRQDNSIPGWSWVDGTFSWVEPTAWCLLALKRLSHTRGSKSGRDRISSAERLLFDRVCHQGGWNYGNSNVLGKNLEPYLPTTALALLALRDRAAEPAVAKSLTFLESHRVSERSALALALTRICLAVFGRGAEDVGSALAEEWERSAFLGNLHVTSLALYALAASPTGYRAFTV
jgi:hypothetical protein